MPVIVAALVNGNDTVATRKMSLARITSRCGSD